MPIEERRYRPVPRLIAGLFLAILAFPLSGLGAATLPNTTPNGILVDRVLPLAHLEELDGSAGAPAAGLGRWRQTMHELRRAGETDLGWPAPRTIQEAGLKQAGPRDVPLALIHARYDRLTEPGQITESEVLALGALREDLYHGARVDFSLDPSRLFVHRTSPVLALTLDPDDGNGARAIVPGVPLTASYPTPGRKTLTLTARLADGRSQTARATIDVKRLATPDPTETWNLTATEPYDGAVSGGQAYLYLAPGHASLVNPVVVVEGFDLDNTMDWPVLYDLLNQQNLLEDLRNAGFDAVVLDFTEATEPIQRNAFLLAELLAQVNAAISPGKTTALVGASMGGLVSRYALLWMEDQAIDHRVRSYVSFDSPHGGANIPLGMQHWLDFFQSQSDDAAFLLSRLNTPAARQMLLYHHQQTAATTAGADPLRAAWLADLAARGLWPAAPRLVAVANGSSTRQDQGFAAGDQIIFYEYRSLLADIDGDVWAVPDGGGPQLIFDGGINLIWPLPDTYQTVSIGGTLPWDSAPGGYRGSMAQMDATQAPYGDIIALHDNHCFIPTVSALALADVAPFHDIAGDPDLMTRTAFDQVYFPLANQEHIALTAENKPWFLAEIQAGVTAVARGEAPAAADPILSAAVPNPFNPSTRLSFTLPEPGRARLCVYDAAGRHVVTLLDDYFEAGRQEISWNGRDARGGMSAAGVYLYRLEAGDFSQAKRLVLLK